VAVRISQQELALFAGLSRQSVNQHLRHWQGAGHLELARGSVRVTDATAMARLAGMDPAWMDG
jgi:DNA-binding transcriptional regulator YdaS (Cro superfamily)